jgi:hypothetical protein
MGLKEIGFKEVTPTQFRGGMFLMRVAAYLEKIIRLAKNE